MPAAPLNGSQENGMTRLAAAAGPRPAGPAASPDRAPGWLRGAMLALAVLAGAAATVSWDAQYVLVRAARHNPAVASLEAGIPDVGALIFAALGIALALHGKRAIRARTLNLACVGISLAMNALASAPGSRDLAIWVMPSAVYALASDTLIGVVRAWVIARARHARQTLADDDKTPLAVLGTAALWLIRLALAPVSTLTGFRRWVIRKCPVTPKQPGKPASTRREQPATSQERPGKQARLLQLAAQRHDLATIPLRSVSKIATALAAEADLSPGTARRVLLARVRELQHNPEEPR